MTGYEIAGMFFLETCIQCTVLFSCCVTLMLLKTTLRVLYVWLT